MHVSEELMRWLFPDDDRWWAVCSVCTALLALSSLYATLSLGRDTTHDKCSLKEISMNSSVDYLHQEDNPLYVENIQMWHYLKLTFQMESKEIYISIEKVRKIKGQLWILDVFSPPVWKKICYWSKIAHRKTAHEKKDVWLAALGQSTYQGYLL